MAQTPTPSPPSPQRCPRPRQPKSSPVWPAISARAGANSRSVSVSCFHRLARHSRHQVAPSSRSRFESCPQFGQGSRRGMMLSPLALPPSPHVAASQVDGLTLTYLLRTSRNLRNGSNHRRRCNQSSQLCNESPRQRCTRIGSRAPKFATRKWTAL